jgi:type I restriction enzyme, S subunit
MATEWREVPLEDVATEITVGHVGPMASEYVESGVPFLRSQNVEPYRISTADVKYITQQFHERLRKSALKPGDVVIVRTGKPGACAVLPADLAVANCSDLVIVRCGDQLDPRFLCYYVNSASAHHVSSHLVGAVQQHFNVGSARKLRVRLPAIAEQRRIAHVLGALDDKRDLNRRMAETLESIVRALFQSWFVDFDPVRAKAEGRETGLPRDIAYLFPERLVESGIGEIPERWGVTTVRGVAELMRDSVEPLAAPDEAFLHFSLPAFDDGQAAVEELGASIKSIKNRVPVGAVLLSKLNPEIERVWLVDVPTDARAVCSTEFLVLVPRKPFGRAFVYCLARSQEFRLRLMSLVSGTSKSHQRAQVGSVMELPVTQPSQRVLEAFESRAEPVLARALLCRRESRVLGRLRDALLPKLVSGDLRMEATE